MVRQSDLVIGGGVFIILAAVAIVGAVLTLSWHAGRQLVRKARGHPPAVDRKPPSPLRWPPR